MEDIEDIANAILDELPDTLKKHIARLKIQVEDFPDSFIEEKMDLETPFDLLGCYQSDGRSAATRSQGTTSKYTDILFLYRRPILDVWADTGDDLMRLVNRVIIQEIGHHFGYSADEIEMYEEDMFGATAQDMLGAG